MVFQHGIVLSISDFVIYFFSFITSWFRNDSDKIYKNDLDAYNAGKIMWFQIRDSDLQIKKEFEKCIDLSYVSPISFGTFFCFIQSSANQIKFHLFKGVKDFLCHIYREPFYILFYIFCLILVAFLLYVINWRLYCLGLMKQDQKLKIWESDNVIYNDNELLNNTQSECKTPSLKQSHESEINSKNEKKYYSQPDAQFSKIRNILDEPKKNSYVKIQVLKRSGDAKLNILKEKL